MDNYNLILAKNDGKNYNITKLASNLKWDDDIDTLGTKLQFEVIRNADDADFSMFDIAEIGDKIILNNDAVEIFRGIITDVDWSRFRKGITCFDYAFYLNQSKIVRQFRKISASKAITELCNTFGVPIGIIATINTAINKVYKDKTIAEIIKDILDQAEKETGNKYRLEMKSGKLFVIEYIELEINPLFNLPDGSSLNILNAMGDISKSESLQDMKNSIVVTSDNEKKADKLAEKKSDENIEKYGLLQEVISVNDKNKAQANNIAKNKLKELNKIGRDITIPLLGNDSLRAGRILTINNDLYKLSGKYLIKSSSHTVNNSIHKCSVVIREV